MRGDRRVAEARRHRAGEDEREHERGRADEDPLAQREDATCERDPHGRLAGRQPPQHDHDERGAHAELCDGRPPRRPGDPPVEAVDEQHLEDDVRDVPRDEDDEGRPQVCNAPQVALRAEREERGREADRRDAEVLDGVVGRLPLAAHEVDELRSQKRR